MTAPKLRLAGFKEPWSPKRLGTTGRILQERTSDFARYPLYSLTIEKGVTKKTERYERGFLVSKTGDIFKIVHPGNFVTNPMNLRFGAVGYSKEKDDVSVSGYYDVFELDDNKCSPFWFNFLKREEMKKRYEDIATGSLIEKKRVHVNDLLNLELPIPELEERKSLGEYLTSLDRLIDAEALRLESLRKLKSACMAKMFAGVGETCPKMRLKGYSGEWIAKRLGDLVNRVDRKNVNMEALIPLTISAKDGLIAQEQFFDKRIASTNLCGYYLIRKGEFAYNRSSSQGYPFGSVKRLEKYDNGALSALYTVFGLHDMISSDFMKAYFDTDKWHGEVRFRACEGARNHGLLNISADDFFQLELRIPPTIEEQNAIGEFMINLDMSIRLQGNRVEKMRHLKWACMERMFV